MNKGIHIVTTFWILTSLACVDLYTPDIGEYQDALVVDAVFSNSFVPSKVVLTRTVNYNDLNIIPEEEAIVEILEMDGPRHRLVEQSPGIYQSDPDQFQGIPGRSYQLNITTRDGSSYESDWEIMNNPVPIANIEKVYEEIPVFDQSYELDKGINLYLSSVNESTETHYYRWSFEETFEFRVPFPSKVDFTEAQEVIPHNRELETCWRTINSSKTLIASSENAQDGSISKQPIQFVSVNDERLLIKYSILIRQHSISKSTYTYHKNILETTETTGSLFDPIPTENFGNMHSLNGNLPIIGYFEVAGIDEERLWISKEEIPTNPLIPTGFEACPEVTINTTNRFIYNWQIRRNLERGLVLVDSLFPFVNWTGFLMTTPRCADCTLTGTNVKPDYWE